MNEAEANVLVGVISFAGAVLSAVFAFFSSKAANRADEASRQGAHVRERALAATEDICEALGQLLTCFRSIQLRIEQAGQTPEEAVNAMKDAYHRAVEILKKSYFKNRLYFTANAKVKLDRWVDNSKAVALFPIEGNIQGISELMEQLCEISQKAYLPDIHKLSSGKPI